MGYLIAAIAALFVLSKSGLISTIAGVVGSNGAVPPAIQVPPSASLTQQQQQTSQLASGGISAIGAGLTAVGVVPIIGTAVAAVAGVIASSLIAASKKRAQEATSENQAVANAVPGWDQGMAQIANNYNNGSITAAQAMQLIQTVRQNYWNEVTPQIQPGRNGCKGGTVTQPSGMSFCGGSYGAACCVGYDDLENGIKSITAAINNTENNGAPALAMIPAVFASKYGGTNRAAYTLQFVRPSASFTI